MGRLYETVEEITSIIMKDVIDETLIEMAETSLLSDVLDDSKIRSISSIIRDRIYLIETSDNSEDEESVNLVKSLTHLSKFCDNLKITRKINKLLKECEENEADRRN